MYVVLGSITLHHKLKKVEQAVQTLGGYQNLLCMYIYFE